MINKQQTKLNGNTLATYNKHKNGMGGVAITLDSQESYEIAPQYENFALDNDEVMLGNISAEHGTARIVKVTKHTPHNLSGYIQKYKDRLILKVISPKFGHYLVLIKSEVKTFDRDEVYNAVITSYPTDGKSYFEVELTNKVGVIYDDETFIKERIKEFEIPIDFPLAAIEEAHNIKDTISAAELLHRQDLRHLAFVTIDGEDARDFDDAVYAEATKEGFVLYVAIADVAHYVTSNSSLDEEARSRGTSIYFPKQVIPMLPEHLSNGVCSLKPNVDRLTLCVEMHINKNGNIVDYQLYNAVINSKARLTYSQVEQWINELSLIPEHLISNITNLYLVYQYLIKERQTRGAIDFSSIEPVFKFGDDGLVEELLPRIRLEAHKLIEECMLAANVSVADFFLKKNVATLFRIHPKPSEEKFNLLKNYLNSIAVKLDVKYAELKPSHIAILLESSKENINFPAIEQFALRSMQLAVYSPDNIGHFGLSYEKYLHFTSPIRRYPDLLVHRALKATLNNELPKYSKDLVILGEETSYTERRAEEISRKVDAFYKCQYASTHIGKTFKGVISSVVNFGLFVYIPSLMLDGLLHVTNLENDYFIFEEEKNIMLGKKTKVIYKIGQEVCVEIMRVDMEQLFIDFKLSHADFI